jgi:orotate phosphoribosyltransferase
MDVKQVMKELHKIGAVKFGEFTLKSGILSPIYIDLRMIVSYPKLLEAISELIWKKTSQKFDLVCGVPYTAIPMATSISIKHNIPMVMRRKEAKAYGTGKIIEGVFQKGQKCLVIDDLVTSGLSIFETIAPLKDVGIEVHEIAVLLDRGQGGRAKIEEQGIKLHSVFTLKEFLGVLDQESLVDKLLLSKVNQFLASYG